jgi:hypothetical protein
VLCDVVKCMCGFLVECMFFCKHCHRAKAQLQLNIYIYIFQVFFSSLNPCISSKKARAGHDRNFRIYRYIEIGSENSKYVVNGILLIYRGIGFEYHFECKRTFLLYKNNFNFTVIRVKPAGSTLLPQKTVLGRNPELVRSIFQSSFHSACMFIENLF